MLVLALLNLPTSNLKFTNALSPDITLNTRLEYVYIKPYCAKIRSKSLNDAQEKPVSICARSDFLSITLLLQLFRKTHSQ